MGVQFNAEVQDRIISYMGAAESTAESAGEFVKEQTPLVAQEYLSWFLLDSVVSAVMLMVLLVCFSAAGYRLIRRVAKYEKNSPYGSDTPILTFATSILVCMVAFVPILAFAIEVRDVVRVTVAPRVVLIEKVASLINGH